MNSLVQGLRRVSAEILVSGVDEEHHLNNLDKVLQRLESVGLTLKKSKCVFGLDYRIPWSHNRQEWTSPLS